MENRQIGDVWMVFMLSQLYQEWPRKLDLSAEFVRSSTYLHVEDEDEFFDDLASWLKHEGYVRFETGPEGAIYGASLTEKGQALLIVKFSEGRTLGERMKDEVKGLTREGLTAARSEIITQLVGALIGAAAKQFTGS